LEKALSTPLVAFVAVFAVAAAIAVAACTGADDTSAETPRTTVPVREVREANTPSVEYPTPTPSRNRKAPQLAGLSGWLNSEPLEIEKLNAERRVVLIDFWTYTCVNCIRTLPYLKIWHDRYKDRGLTIIGVHAPEFEFEKLPINVTAAVGRFGISYPVAQDNRRETWDAFNNAYWPAKYLIDARGALVFQHFGEGEYLETEQEIRRALSEAGWDVSGIREGGYEVPRQDPRASTVTRELYGGYERNYGFFGAYAGQDLYYKAADDTVMYQDSEPHAHNKWYLQGLWKNEAEAIVHARETIGLEDYIAFKFAGRSVNVVIEPDRPVEFDVVIEIDGRPLTPAQAGQDIQFGEDGKSLIKVRESRLYAIVELPEFGIHNLKLRSNSDAFAVFAFTFGVYQEGA
jgi:thiol-disulfide isomerase/thioredoxin